MKKIYLLGTCLTLILTLLFSANLSSQDALVVGTIKNGNPVLTSLTNATLVLKGGLNAAASITDVSIAWNPETGKYVLLGLVQNGNISGKIIDLDNNGGVLRALVGGPGLEITCHGTNCSECVPVVKNWKVRCVCKDNPAQPNSACDMTSKIILTGW